MKNKKKLSLLVGISTLTVIGIGIFNKLQFFIKTSKEYLFTYNNNYYNWRYGKIFYTVKGTGSPILLIHDLKTNSSGYEWKHIIEHFSKTHTVYCIDLIGCGRSDKPKMTYTNYLYVQLINEFIKNVINHKTSVICTGDSSSAVTMACYIESTYFHDIIMINPKQHLLTNKYPKAKDKLLKRLIDTLIIGTFIYNMVNSKKIISKHFKRHLFYNPEKISRKYINSYCESAHLNGYGAKYMYSSILSNYTNININNALKNINNNIHILYGEFEKNKESCIENYCEINPSIETDIIPNSKYLPQLENPKSFIEICEIYLNQI